MYGGLRGSTQQAGWSSSIDREARDAHKSEVSDRTRGRRAKGVDHKI